MRIHCIGVAGTGMGPLAGLLAAMGHEMSGSDVAFDPPIGPELERWGVRCLRGFDAAHLVPAPDLTLECGASTVSASTGTATAQDTCSAVSVTYSDAVTNLCGGSRLITRTWKATDGCGNTNSCAQTNTVRDTTPPALTLPANLVLECPGDTRTNLTGVATALDGCGSVTIGYSDVVSNSCSFTKTVWRTWTATDQCGNSTNGLQTITVVDTQKPTITCPNVSVQCVTDQQSPYPDLAAFRAAGTDRLEDSTLYVTLEPCAQCAGAIVLAKVGRLVFGAYDEKAGMCGSVGDLVRHQKLNHRVEVQGGVMEEPCSDLLSEFFQAKR